MINVKQLCGKSASRRLDNKIRQQRETGPAGAPAIQQKEPGKAVLMLADKPQPFGFNPRLPHPGDAVGQPSGLVAQAQPPAVPQQGCRGAADVKDGAVQLMARCARAGFLETFPPVK